MKSLKFYKILSLLLVVAMISGILLACGSENQSNDVNVADKDDSAADTADDQAVVEDEQEVKILPDLPDVNYEGYTFTFLSHREDNAGWDWLESDPRELVAAVETGEPINDAVYKRNSLIQEQYGVEFEMVTNTDEKSVLNKTVKAGDDVYDAVIIYNNNVPGTVTADLLTETSKLTYIDRSKPWWDDGVNSMSVANKQYLLAGDLLILDNEATNAIIFNKDLMANYGMELPYNLAKEGKWTMDKMIELTKGIEADVNGDGTLTWGDDRFSFMVFNDTLQALLVAGGGVFADKKEDDIPYMSFAEPKSLNILEKAMDLMYKDTNLGVFNVQSISNTDNTWNRIYYDTFMEDRVLFMWIRMRVVEVFRGMESNFGILPMPKFEESQPEYRSLVNPYTGVLMGVPKTAGDLERTSVILEALSAESTYTLQPAYYDIVLSRKFTRDEESADMLDIIFSTQVYDIGGVYSFGSVFSDFTTLAGKEDRNIASYYEKKIGSMEKAIDKVVEKFNEMDN